VPLDRLLKYINWLIAVALGLALAAGYTFVYRPLPQTSGHIAAPIQHSAKITRDRLGVPHIQAENLEDALFLQGYAVAQDRLWQLDALRRLAGGELAEVVGRAALESDREARRLRMRRLAEQHAASLPADLLPAFAAYARGVNHFIETHRNRLPVEFTLLGYDPRPWSIADSVLVGLYMFRDLTESWRSELQKYIMLSAGDPRLVGELFPVRTGWEPLPGSNAWALSGRWTASGKPILANDTHLDFNIPPTWYMIHLQTPAVNVAGTTIPGLPGVIIGHNDRIAWGETNLHYDVQDLYIEKLDLSTGRYLFRGQMEQARLEREVIPVKGEGGVPWTNYLTRHGPVWVAHGGQTLTLKWIAAEPGAFDYPFLLINQARNWQEFRKAVQRFVGPGQNFVYADVEGNIGYQAAGRLPIRKNYAGDVPVDGASGNFEWEGYVPFEQLPSVFNPPSGMIVTANQNPFPDHFPAPVNGNFAPPYRARQIRNLLSSKRRWRVADMLAVQKDVYSSLAHFVARQLVEAYQRRGERNASVDQAVDLLRRWNGQMEKGQAAPLLAMLAFQQLKRAFAERAAPGQGGVYDEPVSAVVVERLLRERPKYWFADFDQVLLRALLDALEEGRRIQSPDVRRWDWGVYNELTIRHPVGNNLPWINRYFNVGPTPMSGSSHTVKQTTRRMGPSMRFVADLGSWDQSLLNLTTGESGQILSRHYKDQWDRYYVGESFPLPFLKVEGDELSFTPLQ
jgi:penicillin amidase